MIQINNLKNVLQTIGFVKDSKLDKYNKQFDTCIIEVDFDNETISYPENKGLIVNDKTTSNFSHPENFVVLECVCRLLEKGYRPEHIELEPRWTLGHNPKGGKADILVKDSDGIPLLIIECKTPGSEFNKEKKNTEVDGGQLFSYWQQEISTQWIALYTTDYKNDELTYTCLVINCTDDPNIIKAAEKDKDVKIYRNARNEKDRFEVWQETYQSQWLDDVIFHEDSQAYKIGIAPLRKGNLKDFTPDDHIVNRFEEILRHNNVSDKENAFNRLVALFICKLVDEIKKQDFDEVDFQYKQGQDTYESLQDRLQRLHQQGMKEFMKEKIFYVEADYAEKLFKQYTGKQRKAAIEELNNTIRILKFYSNNDFAFKEVHNEELFFQNGKILVEVVKLFQPYRIVYHNRHQFLGDLFERLLTKGFKQNEGQYFTPTPITRFIWDSLPVQSYISNNLPKIIDYSCGAGHFLTEAIEAINAIRKNEDNSWVEKNIYGIEKDYRLARVSKVSLFMNGAGNGNIIFGDGLENYPEYEVGFGDFDILVANPPYSVNGFKQHLKLKNNRFEILPYVSNEGSEIETLFVERIAQLLKPHGMAAIILPSPLLTNDSNSYVCARELLLKNFKIHSMVCLGGSTFSETDTNTVIFFLERNYEPPRVPILNQDVIDAIFAGDISSEWEEKKILESYLKHQNIDAKLYQDFIQKSLALEQLRSDDYFNNYVEAFDQTTFKYPNSSTKEEKSKIYLEKLYSFIHSIEKDKIYYFSLIWQQITTIIRTPEDAKGQKDFLGYKWSKRKGGEGIIVTKPGGKMYCDKDRFARGTLACAIRNSFSGAATELSEELSKYVSCVMLKDLVNFSMPVFKKTINTSSVKRTEFKSKYPLKPLSKIALVNAGNSAPQNPDYFTDGKFPFFRVSDVAKSHLSTNLIDSADYLNENGIRNMNLFIKGTILFPKSGASTYLDHRAIMGVDGYVVSHLAAITVLPDAQILNRYLYEVLTLVKAKEIKPDSGYPSLNTSDIGSIKIPIPPMTLQRKIIKECDSIDMEYNTSRMSIDEYMNKKAELFNRLEVIMLKQPEN